MATKYALYGGGTRADAITGLDPEFLAALDALYNSAPPEMQSRLGIGSGYRSIERQRELWNASDKTGKTVARPGHSKHNHGKAVDLYGDGVRLDQAPADVRDWVHANAPNFGLNFPMSYEPWHIEPVGVRGGRAEHRPQPAGTPAPPLPAPIEVSDAPIAAFKDPGAGPVAGNPAAAPGQGGLGAILAAMAPTADALTPPKGAEDVRVASSDGGMAPVMAAQQGVDLANGLRGGVMPDIASLIGLGKRKTVG